MRLVGNEQGAGAGVVAAHGAGAGCVGVGSILTAREQPPASVAIALTPWDNVVHSAHLRSVR